MVINVNNSGLERIDLDKSNVDEELAWVIKVLEILVKSKITDLTRLNDGNILTGKLGFKFTTIDGKNYRAIDGDGIYEETLKLVAK
ncbi:MAG: hypothetical protein PHV23_01045 [Candidatus Gracilibacteria bacterium]|nr:hypothetical protein [Candidatus Gracilibacteria bacterium]